MDTHDGDAESDEFLPTAHTGRLILDASFSEFYRSSEKVILRRLLAFGASVQDAEDALSAAMIEVMGRWTELTNPVAYASQAALSAFYKLRNEQNRRHDRERGLAEQRGSAEQEAVEDPRLSAWEYQDWATAMVQRLPPAQRDAFYLCEVQGYATAEIAALLGKTPATIRKNISLARQRLKQGLENDPDIAPRQRGQARTATQGGTR